MNNLAQIASTAASHIEALGDSYRLKQGAPEWVRELLRVSFINKDTCWEMEVIVDALHAIANEHVKSREDIYMHSFSTPALTRDLFEWMISFQQSVEDVISDLGWNGVGESIDAAIIEAHVAVKRQMYLNVFASLECQEKRVLLEAGIDFTLETEPTRIALNALKEGKLRALFNEAQRKF